MIEKDEAYYELRLSSLSVVGYQIDFDPEKTGEYMVSVDSDVDQVSVNFNFGVPGDSVAYIYQNSAEFTADDAENKTVTLDLEEGNNNLAITLYSENKEYEISYYLNVYKIYSSASIAAYKITASNDVSTELELSPAFSPSVFDYTMTVPYDVCSLVSAIETDNAQTTVETNGASIENGEITSQSLIVGRNIIDTFVTSEDESTTQRYSIDVTRQSPSESELASNARLGGIEIDGVDFEYQCGVNSYLIPVDSNHSQFTLTLTTEVEGARIYINNIEIPSGEAYGVVQHDNVYGLNIVVESEDGSSLENYDIVFARRARNVVEVDTSEELIHALENAQPNDEIRVSAGTYRNLGELYEGNVSFWSNRSGTSTHPIYLIGLDSDDPVVLTSNEGGGELLLKLEGDHWFISGIDFEDARQAVDMVSASNNRISNGQIQNIAENAIEFSGASDNNTLSDLEFSHIGTSAENTSHSFAAVFINGENNEYPDANNIRFNLFSRASGYLAVVIDEYSVNTVIENNRFIEDDEVSPFLLNQFVELSGNKNVIRHNYFDFREGDNFNYLIETLGEDKESYIYQNLFRMENADEGAILAGSAHVTYSTANTSTNGNSIDISGEGLATAENIQPIYYIKPSSDENKCLGIIDYDDDGLDANFVILEECNGSDDQQWLVEAHKSGYVYIKNLGVDTDEYLRPVYDYQTRCTDENKTSFIYLGEKNEDWNSHWRINTFDGESAVLNRQSELFSMTISGGNMQTNSPMLACVFNGGSMQTFIFEMAN